MINLRELIKTKTFWVGVGGVVAAIGGVCTGELTIAQAINTIIFSLFGITGRDTLRKLGDNKDSRKQMVIDVLSALTKKQG